MVCNFTTQVIGGGWENSGRKGKGGVREDMGSMWQDQVTNILCIPI